MSWNTIKIDPADKVFSEYVRRRDKRCVCCGRIGQGEKGIGGLQCSHFWSRGNESTRFDPENCDALCAGCHKRWGGDYRKEYEAFKVKQLGIKRFKALDVKAHSTVKKDRKMALIVAKQLLKEITA
jgi:5-methylcytosine-specific restriction endonuclease McrA